MLLVVSGCVFITFFLVGPLGQYVNDQIEGKSRGGNPEYDIRLKPESFTIPGARPTPKIKKIEFSYTELAWIDSGDRDVWEGEFEEVPSNTFYEQLRSAGWDVHNGIDDDEYYYNGKLEGYDLEINLMKGEKKFTIILIDNSYYDAKYDSIEKQ